MPTDMPDAQSKFVALSLPGQRVALVCNPTGDDMRRKLLAVAVSGDGRTFSSFVKVQCDPQAKARLSGMHKAAGFQYPNALVADGRLLVIYSANKEDIQLSRLELGAV